MHQLTGNPVVDTIIVSVAVTVAPFIFKYINTWVEQLVAGWENSVCIPAVDFSDYPALANPKYTAVVQWLNKHVTFTHGNVEVTATELRPKVTPHRFQYKKFKNLKCWCTEKETKSHASSKNCILNISGQHLSQVLTFVNEVHAAHAKANNAPKKWLMVDEAWNPEPLPVRSFDQVAMDSSVRQDLVRDVDTFKASRARYQQVGVIWKRGYLLHGPPGSGKSTAIMALAHRTGRDVYIVNLNEVESDAALHAMLSHVPAEAIVAMEDIDCDGDLAHERGENRRVQHGKHVSLKALLNQLDGLHSKEGRITVITTNHKDVLDSALIRPGRIDRQILLGHVTPATLAEIMSLYFDRRPKPCISIKQKIMPAEISGVCLQHMDDFDAAVKKVRELVS